MPEIKIKVANLEAFQDAMRQSPKIVLNSLNRAVNKAGAAFLAGTKENIRTGRDMWKPPIDTGYMWNNIYLSLAPLLATITATAEYAVFVHEGTYKMQARPFFEITSVTEQRDIEKIFEEELNEAMETIANG